MRWCVEQRCFHSTSGKVNKMHKSCKNCGQKWPRGGKVYLKSCPNQTGKSFKSPVSRTLFLGLARYWVWVFVVNVSHEKLWIFWGFFCWDLSFAWDGGGFKYPYFVSGLGSVVGFSYVYISLVVTVSHGKAVSS